jgi:hypothetical protein
LLHNLEEGRIPKNEGVVLATSAVFDPGMGPKSEIDRRRAVLKSRQFAELALEVIKKDVPDLVPYLTTIKGIVNPATRQYILIDDDSQ